LGECIRDSPTADLLCFNSSCKYTNRSEERMQAHIEKEHNRSKKTKSKVFLFPASNVTSSEDQRHAIRDIQSITTHSVVSSISGEDSGSIRSTKRGRSTPYDRNTEGSSESRSPVRKTSLGSLSPLRISSPHSHLSTLPACPSPLNRIAFSHPTSPLSDDKMDVDDSDQVPLDDDEVLAKGSLAIIPLRHLYTMPATQLITCTKCLQGISPSTAISHALEHRINLTKAENINIKEIINLGRFAEHSTDVAPPLFPCPPIEGIKVITGFICKICNFCCPSNAAMITHFGKMHKGTSGHSKAHSEPSSIQSYFAYRPKYFPVVPSLHGQNDDDLFAIYLQQCAPQIDALRILNPPLDPNEVPPLLKVTQWHEHLKDHTVNREKVRMLLELTTLPTSNRGEAWMGLPLRTTIEGYMRDVRVKANNASIGIKCLLKECPRFVAL
jgi:hypothetical protein